MIIPIRCFTCGREIASMYYQFLEMCKENKNVGEVLDELDMKLFCCRRMFIGNVEIIDKLLMFENTAKDSDL
ncbi:hypothetical protein EDEG_01157 [Edhazardia aedis USNM 41457]|uniref:DNA-directed RNA polymerases I, II, and III subunit RPABC5 n=1 Tax=Edhazardia aedis (strain USNM 41457) TaxID=1003232 RepID=J9DQ06_EDHAE|nr:hypothetical protein EDEG_01157 [Edhazardia aedis USNM 41457]|eukprot:EJW04630.1 hypothetical protein EDEG_01157 [Edhazardia aedis USNM 41457]